MISGHNLITLPLPRPTVWQNILLKDCSLRIFAGQTPKYGGSFMRVFTVLLVPRIKNHLSSFELGFLNIFSRQNLLRSLSLILFLFQCYKYGAKKCPKNTFDSTLANQKTGKTIKKPLKELPWNQQCIDLL